MVRLSLLVLVISVQPSEQGKTIFQQKCAACHSLGHEKSVGPGLEGITAQRDRGWLKRWLSAPDKMLAAGDPIAKELMKQFNNLPMPNMGLTDAEVDAVISYLGGQDKAPPATAAPRSSNPSGDGEAGIGKGLFVGSIRFEKAGPPCMACHSIGGIGAIGGGALGPDLTDAYSKFGEDGLTAILESVPFPTMNPVYSSHPITRPEQARLISFFRQVSAHKVQPTGAVGRLLALTIGGAGLLMSFATIYWRKRLTGVREALLRSPVGPVEKDE